MLRKFHIDEFPTDRTFILLDKKFHKEIFDYIEINYGFEKLNKLFFKNRLNLHTFKRWKYRTKKPGRKVPQFIPLWFIVKIFKLFPEKFSIKKIEEKVIGYKGPSSSSIIWKPNLPLVEDGRLLKILAHLLGDGFVGGGFGTGLPKGGPNSNYGNTNLRLINSLVKSFGVFGRLDKKIKKCIDKNGWYIYRINIPNYIGYILCHFYKIKFDSFNSRIPKRLFKLDKSLVACFIRAFADDEAHVYDSSIEFYSSNRDLIVDFINLLKFKFPYFSLSKLKINRKSGSINPKYSFSILKDSLEDYAIEIGFNHSEKIRDLFFNIKRRSINKKSSKRGLTKNLIVSYLNEENLSAKQLSRKLFLAHTTVLGHLT